MLTEAQGAARRQARFLWFSERIDEARALDPDYIGWLENWQGKVDLWKLERDRVLAEWIQKSPCTRPSSWWQHDAPEPRHALESDLEYLRRHNLLSPGEVGEGV